MPAAIAVAGRVVTTAGVEVPRVAVAFTAHLGRGSTPVPRHRGHSGYSTKPSAGDISAHHSSVISPVLLPLQSAHLFHVVRSLAMGLGISNNVGIEVLAELVDLVSCICVPAHEGAVIRKIEMFAHALASALEVDDSVTGGVECRAFVGVDVAGVDALLDVLERSSITYS